MNLEQIDKCLDYPTIKVLPSIMVEDGFDRNRRFIVDEGFLYRIEWWPNICYLFFDDVLQIPFDQVDRKNTWPNRSKMNLQFDYNSNTCCILKIENYPEEQTND